MGIKKRHTNEFKVKVVLAALREDRTLSKLASEAGPQRLAVGVQYGVHPIQIGLWEKRLIAGAPRLFGEGGSCFSVEKGQKELIEQLYRKIGKVEVENDWFKKSWVSEPGGEMVFYRPEGTWVEFGEAMWPVGIGPVELVLPCGRPRSGGWGSDEFNRCPV